MGLRQYLDNKNAGAARGLRIEAPPARRNARFGAYVLDLILLGVLGAFLKSIGLGALTSTSVLLYFVISHHQFGQTLGKMVFKIKLVSLDSSPLSIGQLLLREIIGRLVSTLFFMLGYLWPFITSERRAWHDIISKTRVVETDASRASAEMPVLKMLLLSAGTIAVLVGIGVYGLLFTSYPLKEAAKKLELAGAKVRGIKGSLARGFSVESFSFAEEGIEIEFQDVDIHYDLMKLYADDHLLIENISVGSGRLKATSLGAFSRDKKESADSGSGDERKGRTAKRRERGNGEERKLPKLTIDRIDIANLTFEGPTAQAYLLKRFYLDKFHFEDYAAEMGRLWVESDTLDLDLHALQASGETVVLGKSSRVKLKAAAFPNHLSRDVDLWGELDISIKSKSINLLELAGFQGRVRVLKSKSGLVLAANKFTPGHYLRESPPIEEFSARLQGEFPFLFSKFEDGLFKLRGRSFVEDPSGDFVHQRGEKAFRLKLMPASLLTGLKGRSLIISASEHDSAESWLADLYFGKRFEELSPDEMRNLSGDTRFFDFRSSDPLRSLASPGLMPMIPPPPVISPALAPPSPHLLKTLADACKNGRQFACQALEREARRVPASTKGN